MKNQTFAMGALAAMLAGCAPPAPASETADPLTVAVRVDAAAGAQIVGYSADRRRVAYAAPCNPEPETAPTLKIYDAQTGLVTTVGHIAHCAPSLQFSPDGQLAAFPSSDGVIAVWSARTGTVATVSRPAVSGIAVVFAPDSRWLVVASAAETPAAVLDAWDADLVHHVEVGANVYVNPFSANEAVKISPDSTRLLYIGDLTTQLPLGNLKLWERAGNRTRTVGQNVPGYLVSDDFRRIAYLDGVHFIEGEPPSVWFHGRFVLERLDSGRVDVVERDAAAQPLLFAPDGTLVYIVGAPGGPTADTTLETVVAGAAPVVVDRGVFQGYGPATTVARADDGSLAYVAGFNPDTFSGELRVATGSRVRVAARDAVPMTFGFVDRTLVYLHAATSTFPGAAVGSLAAWSLDSGSSRELGRDVTQVRLTFDRAAGRVLYLDHWDAARAAGDLRRFTVRTGQTALVAHDVFAMVTQLSPDGASAGIVTLGPQHDPSTPPPTTLKLAPLGSTGAIRTIDKDTTSFAVANGGRVVYTTNAGLFSALTF
ncbi:MAG: hypothetical protein JWN44_4419 [Myxococcales bacterium]|nr:hypothetical protein [Myxococcales bacterium]